MGRVMAVAKDEEEHRRNPGVLVPTTWLVVILQNPAILDLLTSSMQSRIDLCPMQKPQPRRKRLKLNVVHTYSSKYLYVEGYIEAA